MKKKLIVVNGTMGVGKTETCKALLKRLDKAVWLDGDWCWMMDPWVVTDETKQLVEGNIHHLLRSFLTASCFDHVIFNWVIHQEEIFDIVLGGLQGLDFDLYKISLVCSEQALRERAALDGRSPENIENAAARLPLYQQMDTVKIDTTNKPVHTVVEEITQLVHLR